MRIEVVPAAELRETLARLMQLYLHDLSEFSGEEATDDGRFEYGYLSRYWSEPERHPYLIRVDGHVAGFALVREETPGVHQMAEFFVMRKYRRRGVGAFAARALFAEFKGVWHVAQEEPNKAAQVFWRGLIDEFTDGAFEETRSREPVGPMQVFTVH
jgi:predicted acetyltransferase